MVDVDAPGLLYLVFVEGWQDLPITAQFDAKQVTHGLYMVYTALSRSELYHDVRDLVQPESLLVAPLFAAPKFKRMNAGALKWLRQRGF